MNLGEERGECRYGHRRGQRRADFFALFSTDGQLVASKSTSLTRSRRYTLRRGPVGLACERRRTTVGGGRVGTSGARQVAARTARVRSSGDEVETTSPEHGGNLPCGRDGGFYGCDGSGVNGDRVPDGGLADDDWARSSSPTKGRPGPSPFVVDKDAPQGDSQSPSTTAKPAATVMEG